MEALIVEQPGGAPGRWLADLADEFVEDPECRLVMLGSDADGSVLITIWEPEMVSDVETGVRGLLEGAARLRRLSVVDARAPEEFL